MTKQRLLLLYCISSVSMLLIACSKKHNPALLGKWYGTVGEVIIEEEKDGYKIVVNTDSTTQVIHADKNGDCLQIGSELICFDYITNSLVFAGSHLERKR